MIKPEEKEIIIEFYKKGYTRIRIKEQTDRSLPIIRKVINEYDEREKTKKEDRERIEQPEDENTNYVQEFKFIEAETLCEDVIKNIEKHWRGYQIHISMVTHENYISQAKIFKRQFEFIMEKLIERDLLAIELFYNLHEKYIIVDERYYQEKDKLVSQIAAQHKDQKLETMNYFNYQNKGFTDKTKEVISNLKAQLDSDGMNVMDKMISWEMIQDMRSQRESHHPPYVPQASQSQIVQQPQQDMTPEDMMMVMMMSQIAKMNKGGGDEIYQIMAYKLMKGR